MQRSVTLAEFNERVEMGKFKDLLIERTNENETAEEEEIDRFLRDGFDDPHYPSEADLERMHFNELLSQVRRVEDFMEQLLDRARYYNDPILPEHIEEICERLQKIRKNFH